jgi:hypothetical protein
MVFNRLKNLTKIGGAKPEKNPPGIADGDVVKPRRKGQKVEPKEIRELCELVRKRYSLDVEIWSLRKTKPRDRRFVKEKMNKADATLQKINRILDSWDTAEAFTSDSDRAKFQEIRRRIKMDGKRDWAKDSPFDER